MQWQLFGVKGRLRGCPCLKIEIADKAQTRQRAGGRNKGKGTPVKVKGKARNVLSVT
jgi:hypothetical protein